MSRFARLEWLLVAAVLWAPGPPLRAAEQVTLTNGFSMLCDHQEQSGERVRLFTRAGSGDFMEVNASQIASVATVADPVALAATAPALQPRLTEADLQQLMTRAGATHNLDVDLLASVVRAESGGKVHAVSRTGAQGLMQLMPGTAAQLGVTDSFRADQNINGGTAYLDALLVRYHEHLALALAAYNAGPAAVDKYHDVPPYHETRAYVARVIREFNRRKQLEKAAQSKLSRVATVAPKP